jgi:hypothetical protein
VDASNCFIPCPGDKNYKCGGYKKNSIYAVGLTYSTKSYLSDMVSTKGFLNIQTSKRNQESTNNNYLGSFYSSISTKQNSNKASSSNFLSTKISNNLTTKSTFNTKFSSRQSTNTVKANMTIKLTSTTKKNDISTSFFNENFYNKEEFTTLDNFTDFYVTKITFTPRYYYKKHDLISSTNKNTFSFSQNNLSLPELLVNLSSAYNATFIEKNKLNNIFYLTNSTRLSNVNSYYGNFSNSNDIFINSSSSISPSPSLTDSTTISSIINYDSTSKFLTAIVPILSITSSSFINNNEQSSTSLNESTISENKKSDYNPKNFETTYSLLSNNNHSNISSTISNLIKSSSQIPINSTYKNTITTESYNDDKIKSIIFQYFLSKQYELFKNKNIKSLNETIDSNFIVDNIKTTNFKANTGTIDTRKTSKATQVSGKILTTTLSLPSNQLISVTKQESIDQFTDESINYESSTLLPFQNETFTNPSSPTKIISFEKNISSVTLYVSTFNGILSSSTKKTADLQDANIYLITGFKFF